MNLNELIPEGVLDLIVYGHDLWAVANRDERAGTDAAAHLQRKLWSYAGHAAAI